jgi:hypothetical protein
MIALIDGDVISYTAFPYDRENVPGQVPLGKDENGVNLYSLEQDHEFFQIGVDNFHKQIVDIEESLFADEVRIAVQGSTNFRRDMHPEYKVHKSRANSKSKSPVSQFVDPLRQHFVDIGLATASDNCEADDLLREWSEEARKAGELFAICSIDKDLKCIPGIHYNVKTKKTEEVDEFNAIRFFYKQLLMGDATDNIPGLPGIGEKRAEKLILFCRNEEDLRRVVMESYIEKMGDGWIDWLLFNGNLLHIRRFEGDAFTIEGWDL